MITEDYVSFETAKLLKEKGFDERTNSYFTDNNEIAISWYFSRYNRESTYLSAPTLQMAMKWLREVHKIDITIDPHEVVEGYEYEVKNNWIYQFHLCQNRNYLFSRDIDTSYENCAEVAIKYCLENLI